MLSENEISMMIMIPEIQSSVEASKKKFISKEANFLEISNHDFLSLIMMTPTIGIALANGTISLFEELALNKRARKMSKGGFFLKADPVIQCMKFLIKSYDVWQNEFYEIIKICINQTFDTNHLKKTDHELLDCDMEHFSSELMKIPYAFVRFLSSFFIHDEKDIIETRSISKVEFNKIIEIGDKLQFSNYYIFKCFCATFNVK